MKTDSLLLIHPAEVVLEDGTAVRLVQPIERTGNRPLYVSADGRAFSHIRVRDKKTGEPCWIFRKQVPIFDTTPVNRFNGHRKQRYYKMSNFGNIYLAHAVALAWISPQPVDEKGNNFECHHLNGIVADNRATNLIWLSRQEHRLFNTVQRALRMAGRDLTKMSREEIISTTHKYTLTNLQNID